MSNPPQSNSTPPEEPGPTIETTATQEEPFSYEGYQVVRGEFFSHPFEPYVVLNRGTVSVNPACIRKFPDMDYVQFMVNPEEKKLVIRPCPEDTRDSFRWAAVGVDGGRRPKTISCKIFFGKVMELMNWNTDCRYKILGKLICSNAESLFVFALESAEAYPRKNNPAYCGPNRALYPKDWRSQFGIPVSKHREDALIQVFDEYTVLDIEGDATSDPAVTNTIGNSNDRTPKETEDDTKQEHNG